VICSTIFGMANVCSLVCLLTLALLAVVPLPTNASIVDKGLSSIKNMFPGSDTGKTNTHGHKCLPLSSVGLKDMCFDMKYDKCRYSLEVKAAYGDQVLLDQSFNRELKRYCFRVPHAMTKEMPSLLGGLLGGGGGLGGLLGGRRLLGKKQTAADCKADEVYISAIHKCIKRHGSTPTPTTPTPTPTPTPSGGGGGDSDDSGDGMNCQICIDISKSLRFAPNALHVCPHFALSCELPLVGMTDV
jgi:hypothetical protein